MEKSKALREGDIVAYRANKVIRCGARLRPEGVWTEGNEVITRTLEGQRVKSTLPAGVVMSGHIVANMAVWKQAPP